MVGRSDTDRDDVVDAGDHGVGRHGDYRVEIARGERVTEIAEIIRDESVHQRIIGAQRDFEQIGLSVHLDALFAVLDRRADTGLRENAAEPMPPGADAFDSVP